MPSHILRLILLLLTPLWLSLGAETLGLRLSLPAPLSDWLLKDKAASSAFAPPPGWRESIYLTANPDVAVAVRDGLVPSGYDHYIRFGRAEGRPSGPLTPAPTPPAAAPDPIFPGLVAGPVPGSLRSGPTLPEPAAPRPAAPRPVVPEPALAGSVLPDPPSPISPAISPAIAATPAAIPEASPTATAPLPAAKPEPALPPVLVLRLRTADNGTVMRIVLDLDRPARFKPPVQTTNRLEVDLPGTLWKGATTGTFPALPLTYHVETPGDAVSRLIIGGRGPIAMKAIFALPPEKDRGHRLVIDVDPGKGTTASSPRKRN